MIIYVLLHPVNELLTQLAALFCAIGLAIQAAIVMYLLEAIFPSAAART